MTRWASGPCWNGSASDVVLSGVVWPSGAGVWALYMTGSYQTYENILPVDSLSSVPL